jgi:chemotaxis protein MotA
MLVDGTEPDKIREALEMEIEVRSKANTASAKVFEGMGIYAPTLGIIGAVLGLIAVMKNLADPSKLGSGIAAAFTATIYGIGLANLFFLPIANKLKDVIAKQNHTKEMIIEGIIAIAEGENPRNLETKLKGFAG